MIQNFLKTGGIDGNKYVAERLFQGANGFITQKSGSILAAMKDVAKESKLHARVTEQCGANHRIIDNFLMTFLVMVPGQTLPVHYDVPLFQNIPKDKAPGANHECF